MTDSISAIKHDSRGLSSGVETEYTLLLEKNLGRAELLEEDVCGLNSVAEGVQGWLCQQDRVLLGRGLELIEHVPPELLHVIPVLDNSMLNRIVELQNASIFFLN